MLQCPVQVEGCVWLQGRFSVWVNCLLRETVHHIATQFNVEMLTNCFIISQVCPFLCVYLSNDYVK